MNKHRQLFDVHGYEVDSQGRLPISVVAGYLQEAAGFHAGELGCGLDVLLRRGLTWVLVRQRLEMSRPVHAGERLEVATWPSGLDRMAALRDYELRAADGDVIGRAVSSWFVLDVQSRRPVRPQDVLPETLLTTVEGVLAPAVERLPPVEQWQREVRLPVRRLDIDVNQHVNNAAYLGWVLESVPAETWRNRRIAACDVQYLAECLEGDIVLSRTATIDGSGAAFRHAMVRESDNKEVARALTTWE